MSGKDTGRLAPWSVAEDEDGFCNCLVVRRMPAGWFCNECGSKFEPGVIEHGEQGTTPKKRGRESA